MLIESHLVNVSADIKMLSLAKHKTEYCGALASVNLKNGISLQKPIFIPVHVDDQAVGRLKNGQPRQDNNPTDVRGNERQNERPATLSPQSPGPATWSSRAVAFSPMKRHQATPRTRPVQPVLGTIVSPTSATAMGLRLTNSGSRMGPPPRGLGFAATR